MQDYTDFDCKMSFPIARRVVQEIRTVGFIKTVPSFLNIIVFEYIKEIYIKTAGFKYESKKTM